MTTNSKRPTARLHLLTAREVQSAGDGDHADGGGLLLRIRRGRVSAAGETLPESESWVLRYTAPSGKRREMGLGVAHRASTAQAGASLTTARGLAHAAREKLSSGTDPLVAREAHRDAARAADGQRKADKAREHWTLARAARDYHERVIEPTRTPKHAAQWLSSLENHVPTALWRAPIASIAAPALLAGLMAIKPHERARNLKGDRLPETQRRIRQRLDAVFEDAIFSGRCTSNPAAAIRRKLREHEPRRERGRLLALSYREAPALLQRVQAAPGTAARCLEFAVLTAARTSEALLAEWSEFDLAAGMWACPAAHMKGKAPHAVYLSARALELLRGQLGQDERFVFPSPMNPGKPMSNMSMLAVLDRLGVREQTTVHGLARATFSTWANETGAARPDVIEAALAHEEANRVRAAYMRADFARERRALLEAWAGYLAQPAAPALALRAG